MKFRAARAMIGRSVLIIRPDPKSIPRQEMSNASSLYPTSWKYAGYAGEGVVHALSEMECLHVLSNRPSVLSANPDVQYLLAASSLFSFILPRRPSHNSLILSVTLHGYRIRLLIRIGSSHRCQLSLALH